MNRGQKSSWHGWRAWLAAGGALLVAIGGGSAQALVIVPVFDTSITRLSDASTIESAFDAAARQFDAAFANPVTVNIQVSWGSVASQPLAAGSVSDSVDNLSGPYAYADVVADLKANLPYNPGDKTLATAVADLPASDPTHLNTFEIPYADAKALGLIDANRASLDGYIGFSGTAAYDFNPANGTAAGDYDFEALAGHELEEVLGRMSGENAATPKWATLLDLYRYKASGAPGFTHDSPAYFSINGGKTDLGNYNDTGAGDRGDWLTLANSTDLQSAYFATGRTYTLSANDLTALDALGWGSWNPTGSGVASTVDTIFSPVSSALGSVPEPGTWGMMFLGLALVGAASRLRRRETLRPARTSPQ